MSKTLKNTEWWKRVKTIGKAVGIMGTKPVELGDEVETPEVETVNETKPLPELQSSESEKKVPDAAAANETPGPTLVAPIKNDEPENEERSGNLFDILAEPGQPRRQSLSVPRPPPRKRNNSSADILSNELAEPAGKPMPEKPNPLPEKPKPREIVVSSKPLTPRPLVIAPRNVAGRNAPTPRSKKPNLELQNVQVLTPLAPLPTILSEKTKAWIHSLGDEYTTKLNAVDFNYFAELKEKIQKILPGFDYDRLALQILQEP
jgi:hypothetical protein